jgi:predicted nucleic acid-binding protein
MAILDTTFLIDLMKESKANRPGPATAKLGELMQRAEELRTAVFTVGELYVGVAKGSQPDKERQAIEKCLALLEVVGFEESTARLFGQCWCASWIRRKSYGIVTQAARYAAPTAERIIDALDTRGA